MKMKARGNTGCYTIFDVAPADLSPMSREDMLAIIRQEDYHRVMVFANCQ